MVLSFFIMSENRKKSSPHLSDDKLTIDYDINEFSKTLPNLTSELTNEDHPGNFPLDEIKFDDEIPEDPSVVEFIQRCTTENEALEIINYLEKKEEISQKLAETYRERLKKKGLTDFGPHRERGFYERKFLRKVN